MGRLGALIPLMARAWSTTLELSRLVFLAILGSILPKAARFFEAGANFSVAFRSERWVLMMPARLWASIEQVALVDVIVGGEVLLPDLLLQSTGKVPTAT